MALLSCKKEPVHAASPHPSTRRHGLVAPHRPRLGVTTQQHYYHIVTPPPCPHPKWERLFFLARWLRFFCSFVPLLVSSSSRQADFRVPIIRFPGP